MAFTQEQLDSLKEAVTSGARTVQYGDKTVTYRSLDEMIRIMDLMETELGIAKARRTVGNFRSGKHADGTN